MARHYYSRPGYTALDGRYVDQEKSSLDDLSDSEASCSSRDTARPQDGLLAQEFRSYSPPASRRRHRFKLQAYRFYSRCFCFLLGGLLVIFVLVLFRLQAVSDARVRLGFKERPPPPPAWESFPFLERYYGGIRSLVSRNASHPEYPDPSRELEIGQKAKDLHERSENATADQISTIPFTPYHITESRIPCFLDADDTIVVPQLQLHSGVPNGMPDAVLGSYDVLGLQNDGCFDRYGRLGPYGLGYSAKYGGTGAGMEGEGREEAMPFVWHDEVEIDYTTVKWSEAQHRCLTKNRDRFRSDLETLIHPSPVKPTEQDEHDTEPLDGLQDRSAGADNDQAVPDTTGKLARTVVLVRTWHDYDYDAEDILYLRSLINELALQSGGEYTVHFLIHVRDESIQIWADEDIYRQTLDAALPQEFQGMGTLWSERQMALIYGGLPETNFRDLSVYGVYRSTFMPVQYFAHKHPEYHHFWHWEMDIRYTGHWYDLFNKVESWADKQPRKGLWERNGRFYIPSEHGSWEEFSHMVRVHTELGTGNRLSTHRKDPKHPVDADERPDPPVWGPLGPDNESDHIVNITGPVPPTTHAEDKSTWGVGEPADLITFNPIFDPDDTKWLLADDVTGYNATSPPPPRRAAIITASRLSRRLLTTMHAETSLGRHTMASEMWPASTALHHGLKAVFAPHPVHVDRRWPTSYLAAVLNNGRAGAAGGAPLSVFSEERKHNLRGTTWFYDAGFAARLWTRWLGYRVDGEGGERDEKAGEGRMCLPAMLLHPVKHVDMVYEI